MLPGDEFCFVSHLLRHSATLDTTKWVARAQVPLLVARRERRCGAGALPRPAAGCTTGSSSRPNRVSASSRRRRLVATSAGMTG